MPAAEKGQEHQKVEEQLRLGVPRFENEDAEGHDPGQIGCREWRKFAEEERPEDRQEPEREIDVGTLGDLEERRIGQVAMVEERQVARVERHPVSLAYNHRWLLPVPVRVDVLGVPQVAGLVAAGLGRVDAPPMLRRRHDVEHTERRARGEQPGALDEDRNGQFLISSYRCSNITPYL